MANIYVGFHDQRNSSRVLKPPGGGTSDIFGTDPPKVPNKIVVEEKKETSPIKEVPALTNQIPATEEKCDNKNSHQNIEEDIKEDKNDSINSEAPKIENLNINEVVKETNGVDVEKQGETKISSATAATISSIIQQEEIQIKEPEKKSIRPNNRVPPGGYSSGLW